MKDAKINVAEQNGNNQNFHLREFSVDAGNPLETKCPNLEILIDNPFNSEIITIEEKYSIENNDIEENSSPLFDEKPNGEGFDRLFERIGFLEGQMHHLNSLFNRVDTRIKKIELHQRGCQVINEQISKKLKFEFFSTLAEFCLLVNVNKIY